MPTEGNIPPLVKSGSGDQESGKSALSSGQTSDTHSMSGEWVWLTIHMRERGRRGRGRIGLCLCAANTEHNYHSKCGCGLAHGRRQGEREGAVLNCTAVS